MTFTHLPASRERIPTTLQQVFVASNRGKQVNKPPPNRDADKTFYRNWVFQGNNSNKSPSSWSSRNNNNNNNNNNKSSKSLLESSKEKVEVLSKITPARAAGAKARRPSYQASVKIAPQTLLDELLQARGYSTQVYKTLQTGYYNSPTPLQRASYGPYMISLVRSGDAAGLKRALEAGMSPNPCNQYGESLVHMACRRGNMSVLQVLLDAGATLQVADDYGRTPLHDACWAAEPAFDVVKAILARDNRLFHMQDRRGSLPLSYAHRDHFGAWEEFFANHMDTFFPETKATGDNPPELAKFPPNSVPISEPKMTLPDQLCAMVATGRISPAEAKTLATDDDETVSDSDDESDSEYEEDDSDDEDDFENPTADDDEDESEVGDSDADFESDDEFDVDKEFRELTKEFMKSRTN